MGKLKYIEKLKEKVNLRGQFRMMISLQNLNAVIVLNLIHVKLQHLYCPKDNYAIWLQSHYKQYLAFKLELYDEWA